MDEVRISATEDGPYVVDGRIELVDHDGEPVVLEGPVYLCRCGRSQDKPFCDCRGA